MDSLSQLHGGALQPKFHNAQCNAGEHVHGWKGIQRHWQEK